MEQDFKAYQEKEVKKIRPLWQRISSMAAAILLVLMPMGYLIYTWVTIPNRVKLVDKIHQMPTIQGDSNTIAITETSVEFTTEAKEDKWKMISQSYKAKDYQTTLQYLDDLLYENPSMKYGYLLRGNIHLKLGNLKKAEQDFNDIIDNAVGETLIKEAKWGLGLTYLKKGKEKKATKLFKEVKDSTRLENLKALEFFLE